MALCNFNTFSNTFKTSVNVEDIQEKTELSKADTPRENNMKKKEKNRGG